MHYRRLACLLLGAWIAGSLFMMLVATQNFRAVDRLLAAPSASAASAVQTLGQPVARSLLRYQVSELNRFYFESWEYAQLGLGALLLYALIISHSSGRANIILAGLMLAVVLVMRFYLTPEVVRLGRMIEALPPAQPSPERSQFWTFHVAYSVSEIVKLLAGLALAVTMIRPGKSAGETLQRQQTRLARPGI